MRRILGAVGLIGLIACGGDGTSPDPTQDAVGNYTLAQVNGSSVPMIYRQTTEGRLDIASGSMALRSDLSYNQTIGLKFTRPDGTSETNSVIENGTFSVTGSQITFTIPANAGDPAFSYAGAISGGVVTYTYDGDSYRFEK